MGSRVPGLRRDVPRTATSRGSIPPKGFRMIWKTEEGRSRGRRLLVSRGSRQWRASSLGGRSTQGWGTISRTRRIPSYGSRRAEKSGGGRSVAAASYDIRCDQLGPAMGPICLRPALFPTGSAGRVAFPCKEFRGPRRSRAIGITLRKVCAQEQACAVDEGHLARGAPPLAGSA